MQHAHGPALLASGALTSGMSTTGKPFVVRLHVADEWLRSVDAAIFAVGGSSSAGADCKSHTRLLCTPAYAADHPGWAGDYIRKTCIIGVGARAAVEGLQHSAVELTLQRCCLNNSKTSHLLRCNGDRVDSGLGMREASTIAMPAFASRPMVAEMCEHTAAAGCQAAAETTGGPPALAPGGRLIAALRTEDVERPHTRTANGACSPAAHECWGDLHRLQDLSAPDASHDWLWAVGPHKGARIDSADEFTAAVRLRHAVALLNLFSRSCCGVATLQCSGEHALHCAAGESTRGHNDVRDTLHAIARTTDSQAELEPERLIASHPRLRPPVDVVMAAKGAAAVDVGVISPT
ncbi:unnamed protein product, partial [Symbiodinium sp. KB8]